MEVWSRRGGDLTVCLYVSGSLGSGYRIERQVLGPDDEVETNWHLSASQSRQLRAELGPLARSDALEPADPSSRYDFVVMQALETLQPAANPFTFHSRD